MSSWRKRRKHQARRAALQTLGGKPSATGVESLRSVIAGSTLKVDSENGIIYGAALMSAGVAKPLLGQDILIDRIVLEQLVSEVNARPEGIPVRFTHPEFNDDEFPDDLNYQVGVCKNARFDGDRVVGDIHLGSYAEHMPQGNMREYLIRKAAEDPQHIALSASYAKAFYEPDPATGLRRARIQKLAAIDFVGRGAATPNGLLRSGQAQKQINHKSAGKDAGGNIQTRLRRQATPGQQESLSEGAQTMTQELRDYLVSQGMDAAATDEEAWAFYDALTGDARTEADRIKAESGATRPEASGGTQLAGKTPGKPAGQGQGEKLSGKQPQGQTKDQPADTQQMAGRTDAAAGSNAAEGAAAVERERYRQISGIAKKFHKDPDWTEQQFLSGRPVEDISRSVVEDMVAANSPVAVGAASHFTGQRNTAMESLRAGIVDGITLRSGGYFHEVDERTGRAVRDAKGSVIARQPHERAQRFAALSIIDTGRQFLRAVGVPDTEYLSRIRVAELTLNPRRLRESYGIEALAMGISDFPNLLGDTLGKQVRAAYELAPRTWQIWARRSTAPDFKDVKLISLSEAPALMQRLAGEGIRYGKLAESKEVVALAEYDGGLRFTEQAMINDDTDSFSRLPQLLGDAAGYKDDDVSYAILTANAAMADGGALFNSAAAVAGGSGHANLASGAGTSAITLAALDAGVAAMKKQKGLLGQFTLDLRPEFLIVPAVMEATAESYAGDQTVNEGGLAINNRHRGKFTVVSTARLDDSSPTAWYMLAHPRRIDTVVVLFMEGQEVPKVKSETDFDTDDLKVAVKHYVAAKAVDWRGMFCNPGA